MKRFWLYLVLSCCVGMQEGVLNTEADEGSVWRQYLGGGEEKTKTISNFRSI